jgi:hypothetical protein
MFHSQDSGKPCQAALVRETVGKELLEARGRCDGRGLTGQQVFESDFFDVHRTRIIGMMWQALMTHFRG